MPSKSHKLTARAWRLQSGKGASAAAASPIHFAKEVETELELELRKRRIPRPVIRLIRLMAAPEHIWEDGQHFDCILCGCCLPLAHTSVAEHCSSAWHVRLLTSAPAAARMESPVPAILHAEANRRRLQRAQLSPHRQKATVTVGRPDQGEPKPRRWRIPS
mmetsp:Transcript_23029/g.42422  ORF Transcript_23029/g.42422 Transcript_23029/m.42422 type:complete len:161 (-) Transcript_23029:191-673(-)